MNADGDVLILSTHPAGAEANLAFSFLRQFFMVVFPEKEYERAAVHFVKPIIGERTV